MTFLRSALAIGALALICSQASASLPPESQAFLDKYSAKITKLYVSGGTTAVDDATVTSSEASAQNSSQNQNQQYDVFGNPINPPQNSSSNTNGNSSSNSSGSQNNSSSPLGLDTTQNSGTHYGGIGLGVHDEQELTTDQTGGNGGSGGIQTNSLPGGNTNQTGAMNSNSGYNSEQM